MTDIYKKINQTLTWKRVIGFNLLVLVVLVIPLSVKLTQENADNRSNAANNVIPSATPIPNYPLKAPRLERVSLFFGKPGDTIVLLGKNFGDFPWERSHVFVGNREIKKKDIVKWSDKMIEVTIPEGANSGKVWLRINGKQAVWDGELLVYDPIKSGKIGLSKIGEQTATLWLNNGNRPIKNLELELAFNGGLVNAEAFNGVEIKQQENQVDDFGSKLHLRLNLSQTRSGIRTPLLRLNKANGTIEILSAKPTGIDGRIVPLWTDPLSLKVSF